eukprot:51175-Eustigmatos_ZCMA.PRE.1
MEALHIKGRYFGGAVYLYVEVPKSRKTRNANVVKYPLNPLYWVPNQLEPYQWQVVSEVLTYYLPMRNLQLFIDNAEDEQEFDGRPAYVFW